MKVVVISILPHSVNLNVRSHMRNKRYMIIPPAYDNTLGMDPKDAQVYGVREITR